MTVQPMTVASARSTGQAARLVGWLMHDAGLPSRAGNTGGGGSFAVEVFPMDHGKVCPLEDVGRIDALITISAPAPGRAAELADLAAAALEADGAEVTGRYTPRQAAEDYQAQHVVVARYRR